MRKPCYSKYIKILEMVLIQEKKHSEVVRELNCSYGTIQRALEWYDDEMEELEDYDSIVKLSGGYRESLDFLSEKYVKEKQKRVDPQSVPSSFSNDLMFLSDQLAELNRWRIAYAVLTGRNTSMSIREYKQAIFNMITNLQVK